MKPKVEGPRTDEQEIENMTTKPVLQERNNGLRLHLFNYSLVQFKGENFIFVLGPRYISVEAFVADAYSLGCPGDSMIENPPARSYPASAVRGGREETPCV